MADPITILTSIAVLLLIGILCIFLGSKIKIPFILLLILAGIGIGSITHNGQPLISLPPIFVTSVGLLALAMIVFDSCSNLPLKEFDAFSTQSIKVTLFSIFLFSVILSLGLYFIFQIKAISAMLIFATVMAGTSPSVVLSLFKSTKNKVVELLKIESIINTPFTVLLPFIILDFVESVQDVVGISLIINQIVPFLQQIITGIGTGIVVGIIIIKLLKHSFSDRLKSLSLITAALLAYVIAVNLGGSGVLGVTTFGLLYGARRTKEKEKLSIISSVFAYTFEILVFITMGLVIHLPTNPIFYAKAFGMYLVYVFARFLSISLGVNKGEYSFKEKFFLSVSGAKGIAVAVVALTLSSLVLQSSGTAVSSLPGMSEVLNLLLVIVIFSITVSTIFAAFSHYFIGITAADTKL